ncbi:sigma 54-interacting transcriptional regulator [Roseimaritima sediminicola]|uniref:sigma 54-interacting transcriptional regulator n=1 Tax=Roseimaritima sediminicola TaxID=2662066 RepID=UPI001EEF34C0|nr:sigma 54-interacting transcriptional regulator [Roseimaritima sediminicola]
MANLSNSTSSRPSAYLVIRQGGRWTDVLRLMPSRRVRIGRASTSQIVIHSERCSRQHSEIFPVQDGETWVVRDLNSRNGTAVDGRKIDEDHVLAEGETIEVAGCQMTFVRRIGDAFEGGQGPALAPPAEPENQQTTGGGESATITHRRDSSAYLQPQDIPLSDPRREAPPPADTQAGRELFRLSFELARCDTAEAAAATALQGIVKHLGVGSGAVLLAQPPRGRAAKSAGASEQEVQGAKSSPEPPAGEIDASTLTVLATHQQGERSYHRLPDLLAATVLKGNEAVLARNIRDDARLATPDSRGNLSTNSTVCAPLRKKNRPIGVLHIYCHDGQRDLTPDDLEFIVAAGESLSLALHNLQREEHLSDTLQKTRRRVDQLRQQLADTTKIVGKSDAIRRVKETIRRAAPTAATVLVRGESGTGKELVAAAIHQYSDRAEGPFVCLNCAALSPTLLESELFGHEKGAFTGATERKKGKFEAADGGTLMLDEIGEMNQEIQAKFLRVLEGHAFERVGGNQPIKADVRVVAATNRDLEQAVRDGHFRSDLYFRLHVVEILIPPLRSREQDILLLAEFFLRRFSQQMGRKIEGFSGAAKKHLAGYDWPGNVRELKNVIERAVVLSAKPIVEAEDLVLSNIRLDPASGSSGGTAAGEPELISLEVLEKRHIVAVLTATGGNKSRASTILGIERSTLDRKIRRYELDPQQWT